MNPAPGRVVLLHPTAGTRDAVAAAPAHPVPPSYQQETYLRRAFALHSDGKRAARWFVGKFDVPGPIEARSFAAAIERFAARHAELRSGFRATGDQIERYVVDAQDVRFDSSESGMVTDPAELLAALVDHFGDAAEPVVWPSCAFAAISRQDRSTVFIAFDHIHIDRYTVALALDEIRAMYLANVDGRDLPLPRARDFLEFCAAERRASADPANSAELHEVAAQWRNFVKAGGDALPRFPLDVGSEPDTSYPMTYDDFCELDAETTDSFERLCRRHGGNLYSGLLAALGLAANRVAGQSVFRAMEPRQVRRDPAEHAFGWYASTSFVMFDVIDKIDGFGSGFRETLAAARAATRAAGTRMDVPFDRVVRELVPPFESDRSFWVNYIDNTRLPGSEHFAEWDVCFVTNERRGDTVDFYLLRTHAGLTVRVRYPATGIAGDVIASYVDTVTGVITEASG
ncbi:condensation domain-containing protein [Actinomadura monticuli]|uniref:Condensation domain-containing protein n=1 Tax=Actinomadura monticuli TaxID=3097367 RepID=A0ABV4Q4V6_9ACTN